MTFCKQVPKNNQKKASYCFTFFCLSQPVWSLMKSFSHRDGMKNLLFQNKVFT